MLLFIKMLFVAIMNAVKWVFVTVLRLIGKIIGGILMTIAAYALLLAAIWWIITNVLF